MRLNARTNTRPFNTRLSPEPSAPAPHRVQVRESSSESFCRSLLQILLTAWKKDDIDQGFHIQGARGRISMTAVKDHLQYPRDVRITPPQTDRLETDRLGSAFVVQSAFPASVSATPNALEDTVDLYGIQNWGTEYFDVNQAGEVVLAFTLMQQSPLALKAIVAELARRGLSTPLVLRFPQILDCQIQKLVDAFDNAIEEFEYRREYIPVYPIKVNQKKAVVQEIATFGQPHHLGIEVGSKAELTVALSLPLSPAAPIICNGVKDDAYLKLALMSKQLGKNVFIVLESVYELRLLLTLSKQLRIRPMLGLRLKLSARGSGKW